MSGCAQAADQNGVSCIAHFSTATGLLIDCFVQKISVVIAGSLEMLVGKGSLNVTEGADGHIYTTIAHSLGKDLTVPLAAAQLSVGAEEERLVVVDILLSCALVAATTLRSA